MLEHYPPSYPQGEISEGFQPAAAEENLHSFDSVPEVLSNAVHDLDFNFSKHLFVVHMFIEHCSMSMFADLEITSWFLGYWRSEITGDPGQ